MCIYFHLSDKIRNNDRPLEIDFHLTYLYVYAKIEEIRSISKQKWQVLLTSFQLIKGPPVL